jgi:hypothetical protein
MDSHAHRLVLLLVLLAPACGNDGSPADTPPAEPTILTASPEIRCNSSGELCSGDMRVIFTSGQGSGQAQPQFIFAEIVFRIPDRGELTAAGQVPINREMPFTVSGPLTPCTAGSYTLQIDAYAYRDRATRDSITASPQTDAGPPSSVGQNHRELPVAIVCL